MATEKPAATLQTNRRLAALQAAAAKAQAAQSLGRSVHLLDSRAGVPAALPPIPAAPEKKTT